MPIVVTPEDAVPIPFAMDHEDPHDLWEKTNRAFHTTEFLINNGLEVRITEEDKADARATFLDSPNASQDMTPGKALQLKAMLSQYDLEVVRSAIQLRNYVKLRLLEHSDSQKETVSLRALELLGKLSDVNAFVENVNVTVEHKTTIEIETELATKLATYLEEATDAVVIEDVQLPKLQALPDADEVLGMTGEEVVNGD